MRNPINRFRTRPSTAVPRIDFDPPEEDYSVDEGVSHAIELFKSFNASQFFKKRRNLRKNPLKQVQKEPDIDISIDEDDEDEVEGEGREDNDGGKNDDQGETSYDRKLKEMNDQFDSFDNYELKIENEDGDQLKLENGKLLKLTKEELMERERKEKEDRERKMMLAEEKENGLVKKSIVRERKKEKGRVIRIEENEEDEEEEVVDLRTCLRRLSRMTGAATPRRPRIVRPTTDVLGALYKMDGSAPCHSSVVVGRKAQEHGGGVLRLEETIEERASVEKSLPPIVTSSAVSTNAAESTQRNIRSVGLREKAMMGARSAKSQPDRFQLQRYESRLEEETAVDEEEEEEEEGAPVLIPATEEESEDEMLISIDGEEGNNEEEGIRQSQPMGRVSMVPVGHSTPNASRHSSLLSSRRPSVHLSGVSPIKPSPLVSTTSAGRSRVSSMEEDSNPPSVFEDENEEMTEKSEGRTKTVEQEVENEEDMEEELSQLVESTMQISERKKSVEAKRLTVRNETMQETMQATINATQMRTMGMEEREPTMLRTMGMDERDDMRTNETLIITMNGVRDVSMASDISVATNATNDVTRMSKMQSFSQIVHDGTTMCPFYLNGFEGGNHLEKLLFLCEQEEVAGWRDILPDDTFKNLKKLGEGSYGEVFSSKMEGKPVALKIIPFKEDDDMEEKEVNRQPLKAADFVFPEVLITRELSELNNPGGHHSTPNFICLEDALVVKGPYPKEFVATWEEYEAEYGHDVDKCQNDNPKEYSTEDSLFLIIALGLGGKDVESYEVENEGQSQSLLFQLASSLIIAENGLEFEHRDLHNGNALVSIVPEGRIRYVFGGQPMYVKNAGVKLNIIDFTNSRLMKECTTVFLNLEEDPELFAESEEGTVEDYQREVYRMMRAHNGGDWKKFSPKSNVYWLHYMATKLIQRQPGKKAKKKDTFPTRRRNALMRLWDKVLDFDTIAEFLQSETGVTLAQNYMGPLGDDN